jgi:addiction module RelE/StbE family toxin
VTRILWSPQALSDLESIRDYIAHDSPRYAELVLRRLVAAVDRLETFPESGRVVPERDAGDLREIIVRPYRIVYRLRPGVAEIVTVFRASRLFRDNP